MTNQQPENSMPDDSSGERRHGADYGRGDAQLGPSGQPGPSGQSGGPGYPGGHEDSRSQGQPGGQGHPGWQGQPGNQGYPGAQGHPGAQWQPGAQGYPGGQGPGGPRDGRPNPGYGEPASFDAYGNPIPHDARTLALLSHLSTVIALVVSVGSLSFLGPLIFWLIYKDKPGYQFVRVSSAEAFNFNAIVWIVNIAGLLLTIVTFGIGGIIAIPVMIIVSILALICHIIGAVEANRGKIYRYPMRIRILS
ncbi:DUF4870 domain-containing protein [Curtobacterium sp. S6]|uniref:DUF4870 domain-containing protein n=1 Tax=Curtobacterium sp. S6 TaxID=1479623 RepID=UPI000A93E58E|nr:DUF4870 domain-containing protein [Curtobacterium sp. S6]